MAKSTKKAGKLQKLKSAVMGGGKKKAAKAKPKMMKAKDMMKSKDIMMKPSEMMMKAKDMKSNHK